MNDELLSRANEWINDQMFKEKMLVLEESVEEYDHCYSMLWIKSSEKHLSWELRTPYVGAGRLLISKDGESVKFEGSSPGVDWINNFELEIQNLEKYWILEIPYLPRNISKLKSILKISTSQLLKSVNNSNKIVFTESKSWCDWEPSFNDIAINLSELGITCKIEVRIRKKLNTINN